MPTSNPTPTDQPTATAREAIYRALWNRFGDPALSDQFAEEEMGDEADWILDTLEEAGLRIVNECRVCEGSGEAVADVIDGWSRYDICEQCGGTGIVLEQFRIFREGQEEADDHGE